MGKRSFLRRFLRTDDKPDVPKGGFTNEVLVKRSKADLDVEWRKANKTDVRGLPNDLQAIDNSISVINNNITQMLFDISDIETDIATLQAPVWKETTFNFNHTRVVGQGKPVAVQRGVFFGWELPLWNSGANADEELFTCKCIPSDWDGVSNPYIGITGWILGAEQNSNFRVQVAVECLDVTTNEVVPTSYETFNIDYHITDLPIHSSFFAQTEIDAASIDLNMGRPLAIRLRRVAADSNEIKGNIAIEGMVMRYISDRRGDPA